MSLKKFNAFQLSIFNLHKRLARKCKSTVYMYADDTKIYREIKSEYDHGILQRDLENLKTWSDRWLLKFHPSKCY